MLGDSSNHFLGDRDSVVQANQPHFHDWMKYACQKKEGFIWDKMAAVSQKFSL
jgi:hypothetical protein